MLQDLYEFCEINSGTYNLKGLSQMRDLLIKKFTPISDDITQIEMPEVATVNMSGDSIAEQFGNALLFQKRPHLKRRVLLCGHMDTVYDIHHPFQKLQQINEKTITGPGVTDMKGGLIAMLNALILFEKNPISEQLGWDVFINADEEIGSIASMSSLLEVSQKVQAALVYEPALSESGNFAKNRKGCAKITIIAKGHSAHAGRDFQSGKNAICHLARLVTAIDALNGQREGVTFNVGRIAGGTALNIVPNKAVAKIDIRFNQLDDKQWIKDKIHTLQLEYAMPGYDYIIDSQFARPVKQINHPTQQLFNTLIDVGHDINLTIDWCDAGGCCDGNNLAEHGLAVIDTLGVRGGKIHTSEEFILTDSLAERATLSALLLTELAMGKLELLR